MREEDTSQRRVFGKKLRTLLGVIAAFVLLISINHFATLGRPNIDSFLEFKSAVAIAPITSISIVSCSSCDHPFQIELPPQEIAQFSNAALMARRGISPRNHESPALDVILIIKTKKSALEYQSYVSRSIPDDLFLSRVIRTKGKNGGITTLYYPEFKIPGLAKWAFRVAPGAAL